MKILLVEDDDRIANALSEALTDQNYTVDLANNGQEGMDLAEAFSYDLILLDVMLPKLSGIALCQHLRRSGCHIPILMLTAKDTSSDKVMGLDAGADDYVIKPFDLQELLARIRALLRRGNAALLPSLEWEMLHLNPSTCEVAYGSEPLRLTPKEYGLLELFLRNGNRVLSRAAIIEHVWPFADVPSEETVKVHLKELRRKLRLAGAPADLIETVYGLGYRLRDY